MNWLYPGIYCTWLQVKTLKTTPESDICAKSLNIPPAIKLNSKGRLLN